MDFFHPFLFIFVSKFTIFVSLIKTNMKKLLYIAPHLSTGGLPQYLTKKIECNFIKKIIRNFKHPLILAKKLSNRGKY